MYTILLTNNKNVTCKSQAYSIPWTCDMYNFRSPNKKINVSVPGWQQKLRTIKEEVDGIIALCDLSKEDYQIFAELSRISQIYLYTATNLESIDFIENMIYLRYLCINNSKVSDILPIVRLAKKQEVFREENNEILNKLSNVMIANSAIKNLAPLEHMEYYFSELIFAGNQIMDVTPLRKFAGIPWNYLNVAHNNITDFSAVKALAMRPRHLISSGNPGVIKK